MKNKIASVLILATIVFGIRTHRPGRAAPPDFAPDIPLPPAYISDHDFLIEDWIVSAEATSGSTYTVTQQLNGGFGDGPFRWMSHRLPPVSGADFATLAVTHIYTVESYDPSVEGPITALDYEEIGIILSFPFPEAFSTTQPVIYQGGRLFRSPQFIRFIAENSSHNWEFGKLFNLTATDFLAVDGSGDHPDFSVNGAQLQFGFTRTNSRSSTLPPVPEDQDLVIEQGVDAWKITINRDSLPPQAVDDVFILDGNQHSLPLYVILNVVDNDGGEFLELIEVTQPIYGTAGILTSHSAAYILEEARASDSFGYTISNGSLTSSAQVEVFIDCACAVLCLNDLELPASQPLSPGEDAIDLPLIYQVRDFILESTPDGRRYVEMYYRSNPEILVNILMNESLRAEAVAAVELWQENLRSLVAGDGSAQITQAQVDAIESFLTHLSAVSSGGLQQIIADEMQRLGPLADYVGLTVNEARQRAIGDSIIYLPSVIR